MLRSNVNVTVAEESEMGCCKNYYKIEVGGVDTYFIKESSKVNHQWLDAEGNVITDQDVIDMLETDATDDKSVSMEEWITSLSGGGGGSYTLPQATDTSLGGIKAEAKTADDTVEVKIDTATGKLYVKPEDASSVNDATLTIQKNGTTINTFTANQATDVTIDMDIPEAVTDLSDGADYAKTADVNTLLADKVDKETGKGLSTNDFDDTYKGFIDNYTAPVIPTVNDATLTIQKNGTDAGTFTANSSTNKTINITVPTTVAELTDASDYATTSYVDGKVSGVYKPKGSVADMDALNAITGQVVGDVYNLTDTNMNYVWTGTVWDPLGSTVDLSGYYTKTETDTALDDKVDKETGKGLSSNDYTDAEKTKLAGLDNYTLPQANDTDLGGIKAKAKTTETGEVAIDTATGKLYAPVAEPVSPETLTIQKNGTTIDTYDGSAAKTVNITTPTTVSELTDATDYAKVTDVNISLATKVDKETGKGLSTNDFTDADKTKLDGIEDGAEVNVQSDWTETDTGADSYILNKPTLATVATSGDYNDLTNKYVLPAATDAVLGGVMADLKTSDDITEVHIDSVTHKLYVATGSAATMEDLEIKKNGTSLGTYNGGTAQEINITVPTNTDIDGLITAGLTDYYNKSEIDSLVSGDFLVVSTLPSTMKKKSIYLLEKRDEDNNIIGYEEHIYAIIDDTTSPETWGDVNLGMLDIDLSEYAKTTDLNNKVDKVAGKGLSTEDYTSADQSKLASLGKYLNIQKNGQNILSSTNRYNGTVERTYNVLTDYRVYGNVSLRNADSTTVNGDICTVVTGTTELKPVSTYATGTIIGSLGFDTTKTPDLSVDKVMTLFPNTNPSAYLTIIGEYEIKNGKLYMGTEGGGRLLHDGTNWTSNVASYTNQLNGLISMMGDLGDISTYGDIDWFLMGESIPYVQYIKKDGSWVKLHEDKQPVVTLDSLGLQFGDEVEITYDDGSTDTVTPVIKKKA